MHVDTDSQKIKADQKLFGEHGQKWVCPVQSRGSRIDCASKTEQMEYIDFLYAGTNSGKLKVDSIVFWWAWSKIAEVF